MVLIMRDDIIMTDNELRGLEKQIGTLGERMEKGFERLEKLMSGVEERVRVVETREAGCQPILSGRIDAAWRTIDEHGNEIKTIKKTLDALVHTNNILKWLLGISTAGLTALLIKLVIGG